MHEALEMWKVMHPHERWWLRYLLGVGTLATVASAFVLDSNSVEATLPAVPESKSVIYHFTGSCAQVGNSTIGPHKLPGTELGMIKQPGPLLPDTASVQVTIEKSKTAFVLRWDKDNSPEVDDGVTRPLWAEVDRTLLVLNRNLPHGLLAVTSHDMQGAVDVALLCP